MRTIHLLVEDDYIESFVEGLPKDMVIVIEEDFRANQKMIEDTLQIYKDDKSDFIPYMQSMKDLNSWLKEKEIS